MISYPNRNEMSPYAEKIARSLAAREFISRIFVGEVDHFDPPPSSDITVVSAPPRNLCITIGSSLPKTEEKK